MLSEQSEGVTEAALAGQLAATRDGESVETDASEEVRRIRVRLRHVDLPKLEAAGLVSWDRTDGVVTRNDHPFYESAQYHRIVDGDDDTQEPTVPDPVSERRRVVLSVLECRAEPVARDELAREVAAREADGEPSTEAVADLRVALHHLHLPKLEAAGLIEYDADDGTATADGHHEYPEFTSLRPSHP